MTSPAGFEPGFRKTVRWTLFTDGVIIIVIGILGALLGALNQVLYLAYFPSVIGGGLLVSGLNYLVPYAALKKSTIRPRWFLFIGILNSIFGVLFLTRIVLLLFKPSILTGIWMIFAACARACMAFENFRAGVGKWWITLTVGGYMLFAAAVMMTNTSETVSIQSWISMMVSGMFIINEGRKLFKE